MRNISKFLKYYRYKRSFWHDYYWNIWFVYHNVFFGSLISRGKKLLAYNMFLNIKYQLKIKEKFDPYFVFLIAMMKISPSVLLIPLKRSGVIQGVPFPITDRKKVTFAIKWVIKLLKDSKKVVTVARIVELLVSSIYGRGATIKKKRMYYFKGINNRGLLKFYK